MGNVRTVRAEWRRLPGRVDKAVIDLGTEYQRQVLGDDLFLVALARLNSESPARQVLEAEGVTVEVLLANIRTGGDGGTSAKLGMGYSPAYYALHARAERLAGRGGCWFTAGEAEVHLGVDPDFRPARKAHPAILVRGLAALAERLREAGVAVTRDAGSAYVDDPFGNRVELLERGDTLRDRP